MASMPNQSDAARLQCSSCEKTYSRISHLRRHEATHSTDRQIVCPSCSKTFVRIDVARRHIRNCADDGDSIVLPTAKRGKKPKACDKCCQSKVSCDLKTPCSRCSANDLPCSYLRVDGRTIASTIASTSSVKPDIPWLLRLTNPQAYGIEDAMSYDMFNEDPGVDDAWNMPIPLELGGIEALFADESFPWGPAIWSTDDPMLSLDLDTQRMDIDQSDTFHSPLLMARMDEIVSELAKTHERMRQNDLVEETDFNLSLAQTIFTTYNLEHFIWVYFRRVHPYHPILHPPTFNCESTSLPLLLAVFLYGALFSTPIDDAISTRSFFDVAEEYIFNHPDMQQLLLSGSASKAGLTATIEVLQAALSILIIQTSKNDERVRRRIRVERSPRYNAAARCSGIFQAKHRMEIREHSAATWGQYIEDELRIRLAHYTQFNNNFVGGCFNAPIQVYLCEMVGDMPSRWDLFEARTPQAFAELAALEPSGPRPQSLAKSISILMNDSWSGPTDEMYNRVTRDILILIMSALGIVVVVSRFNCLLPTSSRALLLACMRWKSLWDFHHATAKIENKPPQPGFSKHAMEMWWFAVALIKVQQSGDMSSDYMTKVALDSLSSVNEFLRRYKETSSGPLVQ